jgi:hypothetical protein
VLFIYIGSGPGSVVGIATAYGLDGPGIESQCGARYSAPVQTGPPSLLYNGYRVFPGGKVRPGRDADPSPRSSAEVKSRSIPLLSVRAFVAYERVKPIYITRLASYEIFSPSNKIHREVVRAKDLSARR